MLNCYIKLVNASIPQELSLLLELFNEFHLTHKTLRTLTNEL